MEIGGNESGCFVEGLILGMGRCGSCWSNVATCQLKMTFVRLMAQPVRYDKIHPNVHSSSLCQLFYI
jgi:hypothetical protein